MNLDRSNIGQDRNLHLIEVLRLLQHLVLPSRTASGEGDLRPRLLAELGEDMEAFCRVLELRRAAVYEAIYEGEFLDTVRLVPLVERLAVGDSGYADGDGAGDLSLAARSEIFTLLSEGQCIPLGHFGNGGSGSAAPPQPLRELAEFLGLRGSASAVLFPLASSRSNRMRGLVLMERDSKAAGFSENLLDLGSVISQMLEPKLTRLDEAGGEAGALAHAEEAFERRVLPVVVIDRKTLMIERVNDAASQFLAQGTGVEAVPGEPDPVLGRRLSMVFPGASHFIEVLEKACAKNSGPSCFSLAAKDLSHTGCAFALISFVGEGCNQVWVQLIPENFLQSPGAASSASSSSSSSSAPGPTGGARTDRPNRVISSPIALSQGAASGRASASRGRQSLSEDDEQVSELSRLLSHERWLRQTICKLHSSLDRDHVLQTLADSLGRAFRTTRCLVIRTDVPSHPMVTHEYVEPDLSPLGLGRTGQFPLFAISLFTAKTISYGDVADIKNTGPLIPAEVEQLLENGILSMAGAPISYQGQPFGVLILVDGTRPRKWTEEELETIELTAAQASVSLWHSQTYHQAKDQLFHMNLLGNLTQQLTNALEVATKAPSKVPQPVQDKSQTDGPLTPLSSRELEVLRLIASGFANREIAQRLFLTESTVELHASRIRKKLHLKSRTALVKYACDYGLV